MLRSFISSNEIFEILILFKYSLRISAEDIHKSGSKHFPCPINASIEGELKPGFMSVIFKSFPTLSKSRISTEAHQTEGKKNTNLTSKLQLGYENITFQQVWKVSANFRMFLKEDTKVNWRVSVVCNHIFQIESKSQVQLADKKNFFFNNPRQNNFPFCYELN